MKNITFQKNERMSRPKRRPTEIISVRIPRDLIYFFGTLENRNQYILNLIQNDEIYKKYLQEKRKKEEENQPSLFDF